MPHLIIEYAEELYADDTIEQLLDGVQRAAAESGLFELSHIRVRATAVAHYRVGGERKPFIHLQARIHAGRTDEQKRALSEALLAAMREQPLGAAVATVEVVEMERASYSKYSS